MVREEEWGEGTWLEKDRDMHEEKGGVERMLLFDQNTHAENSREQLGLSEVENTE